MKFDLIDKLFNNFELEKNNIKKMLITELDKIMLESEDQFGKVKLIITYERKKDDDNIRSKE